MTATALRAWPAYRPFAAQVVASSHLSPNLVRVTLTGSDFDLFGRGGLDQRIKLVLPFPDGRYGDFGQDDPAVLAEGTWYANWRRLPDAERNPIRTYTVRSFNPEHATVDVDFVLHDPPGPATAWAIAARPGDEIVLVGPDARAPEQAGIDFRPGMARHVLLVGDETALPAMCSIIESHPIAHTMHVIGEVPTDADIPHLATADHITSSWVARNGRAHGESLIERVHAFAAAHPTWLNNSETEDAEDVDLSVQLWESPAPCTEVGVYAWVAAEASVVRAVRRFLRTDCGLPRSRAAFMGYWRAGHAEST